MDTQPLDSAAAAAAAALVPASPPPNSSGESASPGTKRAQFQSLAVVSDDSPMNSEDFCPDHPPLPRGASPQRDSQQEDPHDHVPSDEGCPTEHGSTLGAKVDATTPEEAPKQVGYIQKLSYRSCSISYSFFQQQQQQQ